MSPFQQRDNSGSLFRNENRSENGPNARGKAMIGGKLFEISAWTKRDRNGNLWQSLSFKPLDDGQAQIREAPKQDVPFDDHIPF